nr:cleft lip and palate transmembrane protein 1 homolog isoform X1 [Ipomoea trifida]
MGQMLTGVIRMAIFWYFASKFFSPKRAPSDPSVQISNLFHKGEPLNPLLFYPASLVNILSLPWSSKHWKMQVLQPDMWLYLSEQEKFNDFGSETALFWHETNIPYAVWGHESSRSLSLKYFPSEALKHNGSLYAHVFFARSGYSPDPSDPEYQPLAAFGRTHPVVTYLPKSKADKKKSLLGNAEDSKDESDVPKVVEEDMADSKEDVPVEWVSYWKPNVTISLVDDFTRYTQNAVPPNIAPYLNIEPTTGNYFPTVFFNEFWLLKDKFIPINDTVTELPLHLEVSPISMTKWQLFLQIDQSFQIHRSYGSMLEGESDELKRVFLEGNPYLLAITMVVSLLHSVFDFLAFKNDIQFWNKNKSMEGLSAKSVIVNFICQLIVFLYLLDNETSWMILASSGIGCCIEFWKIGKAMHIEIDRSGKIPMLRFRDRESYAGNKTKEYDDLAMKYLSYLLFFLVLFINYKLKSVAHLPWRQMTYKFLNTIIDDLFAFVIKMPTLHRLSVFRDDLIFLIYLYQRWIYPVDRKRVNEFGFGGEDVDQASSSTGATIQASSSTDATIQNEDEKKTN